MHIGIAIHVCKSRDGLVWINSRILFTHLTEIQFLWPYWPIGGSPISDLLWLLFSNHLLITLPKIIVEFVSQQRGGFCSSTVPFHSVFFFLIAVDFSLLKSSYLRGNRSLPSLSARPNDSLSARFVVRTIAFVRSVHQRNPSYPQQWSNRKMGSIY